MYAPFLKKTEKSLWMEKWGSAKYMQKKIQISYDSDDRNLAEVFCPVKSAAVC